MDTGIDLARVKCDFERDGYVVVEGIFGGSKESAAQNIDALRRASADATSMTRAGKWAHRRIIGKQFPPYDTVSSPDSWGVQHLLHPDLPHHESFADFYGSSPLLDVAAYLLDTTEDKMQLELFNLLIEPSEHCFALGWHRDDVRPDVTREEEVSRLAAPTHGVQWNACLYDDDCLFLVPGTHRRLRTKEESTANQTQPPAARKVDKGAKDEGYDGAWEIDPPETLRVSLKAGQTAFYSQRILHRASYLPSRTRATLHGCYGEVGESSCTGKDAAGEQVSAGERARNVLQHGVEWMKDESFGSTLPVRLQPLWHNLIRMSAQYDARALGFSLEG